MGEGTHPEDPGDHKVEGQTDRHGGERVLEQVVEQLCRLREVGQHLWRWGPSRSAALINTTRAATGSRVPDSAPPCTIPISLVPGPLGERKLPWGTTAVQARAQPHGPPPGATCPPSGLKPQ